MQKQFFRWQKNDLILSVYVQPSAKKNEIVGAFGELLKIKVVSPPCDNEANETLVKFLAEQFDVPRSHVTLLKGTARRRKKVSICAPKQLLDGMK